MFAALLLAVIVPPIFETQGDSILWIDNQRCAPQPCGEVLRWIAGDEAPQVLVRHDRRLAELVVAGAHVFVSEEPVDPPSVPFVFRVKAGKLLPLAVRDRRGWRGAAHDVHVVGREVVWRAGCSATVLAAPIAGGRARQVFREDPRDHSSSDGCPAILGVRDGQVYMNTRARVLAIPVKRGKPQVLLHVDQLHPEKKGELRELFARIEGDEIVVRLGTMQLTEGMERRDVLQTRVALAPARDAPEYRVRVTPTATELLRGQDVVERVPRTPACSEAQAGSVVRRGRRGWWFQSCGTLQLHVPPRRPD
jgi:hypothetical protein